MGINNYFYKNKVSGNEFHSWPGHFFIDTDVANAAIKMERNKKS